jgi:ABC-type thiamin/hydroxymethylpyrimidine transport system permease subunit
VARALVTSVLFGVVIQCASVFYGYLVPRAGAFARHFMLALASTFLLSLGHSMTMFFFIGTGKHVKELVREHGLGAEIVKETILYKNKLFPVIMLAIGVTMAQFILGGGVHTRVLPVWLHAVLGWATVASNMYCLLLEARYLVSNARLMNSVYRAVDR